MVGGHQRFKRLLSASSSAFSCGALWRGGNHHAEGYRARDRGRSDALRLCLERIIPARRDRPVRFELPQVESIADAVAASVALLTAVAAGDLTPSEAADIGKLVDSYLRSTEATEFEQRLARLEKGNDNEEFLSS